MTNAAANRHRHHRFPHRCSFLLRLDLFRTSERAEAPLATFSSCRRHAEAAVAVVADAAAVVVAASASGIGGCLPTAWRGWAPNTRLRLSRFRREKGVW